MPYSLNLQQLSIDHLRDLLNSGKKVDLGEKAIQEIERCHAFLQSKLKETKAPIYGINTGFGSLCNTSIPSEQLEQLQINLVRSHACGLGEAIPEEVVRIMLVLKAHGLSYGKSGVQRSTVEQLLAFYNAGVFPVVYENGSLGASGDLAPLAHLTLPLIGEGEVMLDGKKHSGKDALKQKQIAAIQLGPKEGLALLNGTQFMSSFGTWLLIRLEELVAWADIIAAISLEAYDGLSAPFDPSLHRIRPHKGQQMVSENILSLIQGSEIQKRNRDHVQDPYSFRCVPQVHGASRDALHYVRDVIEREINSVTDNPTLFPEEDKVLSGGNFHGQPLALALDFLSIAVAELGSISERRIYKLISGTRGLPPFLAKDAGLNSGFMIPQYTAASIASQNKQWANPASTDSIDSSNGQEDHVSMGANAATKAKKVVDNLEKILGIELLTACQAIEFRRPLRSGEKLEKIIGEFRNEVPFLAQDEYLHPHMEAAQKFVRSFSVRSMVNSF